MSNIDVNRVVDILLGEIAEQSKQIALLKVQLVAAEQGPEASEETGEDDD